MGTRTEWTAVVVLASLPWIGIWLVGYLWLSIMQSEKERVRAFPAPARYAYFLGQVLLWFGSALWLTFGLRVTHGALMFIFLSVVTLWIAAVLAYRRLTSTARAAKSR